MGSMFDPSILQLIAEAAITRLGGTYIGYELMEDYTSGKGRVEPS